MKKKKKTNKQTNSSQFLTRIASHPRNKQQEKYCVSRAKIRTLGGVDKIGIGPGWTGLYHELNHGSDHRKKSFKLKKKKSKNITSFMS